MTLMGSTLTRLTAQQIEADGDIRRALSVSEKFLARYLTPHPRLADGLLFQAHGRRLLAVGDTIGAAKWLAAADDCFTALGAPTGGEQQLISRSWRLHRQTVD